MASPDVAQIEESKLLHAVMIFTNLLSFLLDQTNERSVIRWQKSLEKHLMKKLRREFFKDFKLC
jgi:hypothetical protein